MGKIEQKSQELIEKGHEPHGMCFEAKTRYLASSNIITIPIEVARGIGLQLGDSVLVNIWKKESLLAREMIKIELACERAEFEAEEIQTVLGCIRYYLSQGHLFESAEKILGRIVYDCPGAEGCGLCYRVVGIIETLRLPSSPEAR